MSKVVFDFESSLEIKHRENFGGHSAKNYRKDGFVTVSIYSNGKSLHGLLDVKLANKMINFESIKTKILNLLLNEKKYKCIIKNFTIHPANDTVEYIEFLDCSNFQEVDVLVPVSIVGKANCPGLKKSGKINIIKYEIPVTAKIDKIPSEIVVDISKFGLGRTYTSREIIIDGVTVNSDFPVLSIIGRGKKDEEEAVESTPVVANAQNSTAQNSKQTTK